MKRNSSISMGPGASSLILIFVMLSLSVLAILTLVSSKNDANLSDKSARVVEEIYVLYNQSEGTRAEIAEILEQCRETASSEEEYLTESGERIEEFFRSAAAQQDGRGAVMVSGDEITWQESDGVYTLDCAVRIGKLDEDNQKTASWSRHDLILDRAEMEEEWN